MDRVNKEEFEQLPKKIRDLEEVILQKNTTKNNLSENISLIELETNQEVLEMSSQEEHKKELSNAEKRKAKVNELLSKRENYLEEKKQLKQVEEELSVLYIDLAYYKRLFRFYESMSRVGD